MRILAFDTATAATAVALVATDDDFAWEMRHDPPAGERPGHASQLLTLANRLLTGAELTFADVDRVVVGTGPGTFTGLRIGVATARALAQGADAELVGVGTLRALAEAARAHVGDAPVAGVLDARRGEAFAAVYRDGEETVPPTAVAPGDLTALVQGAAVAVGDGAIRFRDVLAPSGIDVPADDSPLHRVSALALARLGAAATPGDVTPDYVRIPDAEIARRKREREAAA